jgi:hypothetical protein
MADIYDIYSECSESEISVEDEPQLEIIYITEKEMIIEYNKCFNQGIEFAKQTINNIPLPLFINLVNSYTRTSLVRTNSHTSLYSSYYNIRYKSNELFNTHKYDTYRYAPMLLLKKLDKCECNYMIYSLHMLSKYAMLIQYGYMSSIMVLAWLSGVCTSYSGAVSKQYRDEYILAVNGIKSLIFEHM